ncbi:MAG: MmcQ/YjbR family DNA-binding protein [Bacteroidota bacterium]|nr:MmcQ/YjbR family DNA-binding protein [Bacteroidota bacterium]
MNILSLRTYCMGKPGVTESFPFDEDTLVFKVMGKMFLYASLERIPLTVTLKCEPAEVIERRELYDAVLPASYMNKRHWVTVRLDGTIPDAELRAWIDRSYDLVVRKLPLALRSSLLSSRTKSKRSSSKRSSGARGKRRP